MCVRARGESPNTMYLSFSICFYFSLQCCLLPVFQAGERVLSTKTRPRLPVPRSVSAPSWLPFDG